MAWGIPPALAFLMHGRGRPCHKCSAESDLSIDVREMVAAPSSIQYLLGAMPQEVLPYETRPPVQTRWLAIEVADDHVTLCRGKSRWLVVLSLATDTLTVAVIFLVTARFGVTVYHVTRTIGVPVTGWAGHVLYQVVPALLWSAFIAVRWIRYWRFGVVPLRLEINRDGVRLSRPGILHAIKQTRWLPADVQELKLRPVPHSLTRNPPWELRIKLRGRAQPLSIQIPRNRSEEMTQFAERARDLLQLS